jgi:hypothetical protein
MAVNVIFRGIEDKESGVVGVVRVSSAGSGSYADGAGELRQSMDSG